MPGQKLQKKPNDRLVDLVRQTTQFLFIVTAGGVAAAAAGQRAAALGSTRGGWFLKLEITVGV